MKESSLLNMNGLISFEEVSGIEEVSLIEENGFIKPATKETLKVSQKRKKKSQKSNSQIKKTCTKKSENGHISSKFEKDLNFLNYMRSWSSFGIQNEILYALYEKKYYEPTKIQLGCLGPAICGQSDILGAAETGSGKTLAFGIPIVNGILSLKQQINSNDVSDTESEDDDDDEESWEKQNVGIGCVKVKTLSTSAKKNNKLFALILTPTRELAVQVKDHLADICKYTDIKIALVVGGLAYEKQERILNRRPEIVVATPGRLWELINDHHIHLQNIKHIRYLAIDETDRMLEKGHFTELSDLLERINLNERQKRKRQNFIFSATLTLVHDPPSHLKGKKKKRITPGQKLQDLIKKIGITNPKVVDLTSSQVTAENLVEYKIFCKFEEKDYYLYQFLRTHKGRTIVFCNSIGCVKRLANLLTILNRKPLPLHANMEQKQRLKNLEKFRANDHSVLLATDVAARGLDIPNVNHVIHFQVPKTAEIYVHRSGRTARVNTMGNALLLIEPQELGTYNKLLHTLGRAKDIEDFDIDMDTFKQIRKIIHLARDIDQLSLSIKRENSKTSWFERAVKDLDIIVDEDEMPKKRTMEADIRIKKDLNLKKKELNALLSQPVVSQNFSHKFPDMNFDGKAPMTHVRRDKLRIPGAFVLRKVPVVN
ncbi:hypothetical protein RUM44_001880 [Polyplax serrata]|uniref:ATP-dependent RNA helicase n=1 Tax=Polyplax serrata TaxID=468196 RepID=A0ABR1ALB7_POLSC